MAVRPIDANIAMKKIREYMEDFPNASTRLATCRSILSMLGDENQIPAPNPPNEPLTLEQLREMDGEPVWVEDVKHWALIDIEKSGQWDGVPFAIWAENGTKFTYNVESRGLHCYRCPPEGEA
jgi:hypothetical protein